MNRIDIINSFIQKYGYQSYLEIGCQANICFNAIEVKMKTGVDPEHGGTHRMTSDEFFQHNNVYFDLIFIDGLHTSEQVKKDILNALQCLKEGGTIICHDCNPEKEIIQRVPQESSEWCGDVWKTWVEFRKTKYMLSMFVVDTDYGVGVIRRGRQNLLETDLPLDYIHLNENRKEWLNLISIDELKLFLQ